MKFKYFLRGLGVGIIFTSLICLAAYQNTVSNKMTDAQVIKRAKQLGMVEQEDKVGDLLKDKNDSEKGKNETQAITQEKAGSSTQKITSEIDTTEKESTRKETTEKETAEKETTEKNSTPKTTEEEKKTEADATEQTDSNKTNEKETVELVVERGTTSYPVCQKLEALGMIKNAEEFDNFLIENGYANRLRVGTHKLKKGMDYRAIAEAISDPQ